MKPLCFLGMHYLPLIALLSFGGKSSSCSLTPTRFRTNNNRNPLAIVDNKPVFSWAIAFKNGRYAPPEVELGVDHHQSAYRVTCKEVRDGKERDNLLWDSGKVLGRETLQVEYSGTPLRSLQRIQWHVEIWDENGESCESVYKDPWFETGLLDDLSWGDSQWIARFGALPANTSLCLMTADTDENQVPRFRAVLPDIPETIVEARAYISGLGYYHLFMNGQKVGDALLDPGWTTYSKRVLYSAYNVTSSLLQVSSASHQNVVGVELGNGWWNPLPLLLFGRRNIRKELVSGQNIASSRPMFRLRVIGFTAKGTAVPLLESVAGPSSPWRASGSPTTFNNIYLGEKYDARLKPAFNGWATADYKTDYTHHEAYSENYSFAPKWHPVVEAEASGVGKLEAQEVPPIRRKRVMTSSLLSTDVTMSGNRVGIIDTGINHAGSCRVRIRQQGIGAVGEQISLRYGELLNEDGSVNVLTSVVGQIKQKNPAVPCQPAVAYQGDVLILGSDAVDWTPSWSWHGFRYIEVSVPSFMNFDDIAINCFTMRSDVDIVANFSSSNLWLSDLRQLVKNTYESNMMSVQSDCPHRERFGYGGDALGCGEAGMSIYDFSSFYRKRILDYNDAQVPSPASEDQAGFTETSPFVGIQTAGLGPQMGPIGWETFQPEALLWLYKYYGDVRTMRQSFAHTQRFINLLDSEPDAIEEGLGDWLAVHETDVKYTGRGFQYMAYNAFANITEILGMPNNLTALYRKKARDIVEHINSRFMDTNGAYRVGTGPRKGNVTQTGQGMALFHGFLSSDHSSRTRAFLQLVKNAKSAAHLKGACRSDSKSNPPTGCKQAEGGPGPHMTTGLFGIKWVLMALADAGMNDLVYDMVTTQTFPSLGWMMNNPFENATTIWESFYFSDGVMSHNHPMFSSTEVWILQSVAGIQPHPAAKGMDHVLIKPNPPTQLRHASASFESPRGIIHVAWERSSFNHTEVFTLNLTIPPNCKATVHVPAVQPVVVFHNGAPLATGTWVPNLLDTDRGASVVEVGSGQHIFQSSFNATSATGLALA